MREETLTYTLAAVLAILVFLLVQRGCKQDHEYRMKAIESCTKSGGFWNYTWTACVPVSPAPPTQGK